MLSPVFLASGAVVGCSAASPPPTESVGAASAPLAPSCSDADLAWGADVPAASQRCAGPWLATPRTEHRRARPGECGRAPDGAPTANTCNRPEFGVATWAPRHYELRGRMERRVPPGCHPPPIETLRAGGEGTAARTNCNVSYEPVCLVDLLERAVDTAAAEAATLYNGVQPPVDGATIAGVRKAIMATVRSQKVVSSDNSLVTCVFDVQVPTLFAPQTSSALCGETPGPRGADYPCGDEISYTDDPTIATGAGTSRDAVCGSVAFACMSGFAAPTCSTCEGAQSTSERFACLESSRRNPLLDATAKNEVARREKLLFELHGHELNDADRATLEALYSAYPTAVSACGPMATSVEPATDAACAKAVGTLSLCNALTQAHVPSALVGAYANRCLTLTSDAPPSCVSDVVAAEYEKVAIALLTVLNGDLPAPAADGPSADRVAALVSRLGWASAWYGQASALAARGVLSSDALANDARAVAGVLGQLALSSGSSSIPGAVRRADGSLDLDPGLARKLDDTFVQEALRALAASTPTLPAVIGAPLATATVARLASALERTTDIYDVTLSLIPLSPKEARPAGVAETYALLRALAALDDDAALTKLVSGGVQGGTLPAGWSQTLALASKGGIATLLGAWSASGDPSAAALTAVLARAAQRADHLDRSGMFTPERTMRLRSSLLDESEAAVRSVIDARKAQLHADVEAAKTNRPALVQTVLSELEHESSAKSVAVQIDDRLRRLAEIDADTVALRQAQAKAELAFHDIASQYRALADAANDTEPYATTTWGTGAASTFSLATVKAVRHAEDHDLAKIGTLLGDANPGDLVRVSPSGQWSPTCALRSVVAPDGNPIDVAGEPLTGAEGFTFLKSDAGYAARTVTKTHTESVSQSLFASVKACASASSGFGITFGVDGKVSFSVEACTGAEWRRNKENSTAQSDILGTQAQTQLAFNVGVRSSEVPVPAAPVGSLLALQVPHGERDVRRAVRVDVVRDGGSSIVVRGDGAVDVYLLPNEVTSDACNPASTAALTVTAVRAVPKGAAMAVTAKAMAQAIEKLRVEAQALEGQGRLLPSDTARLSAVAETLLASALGTARPPLTLNDLPPSAHAFFQTVTAQTIGTLERTIELRALERAREGVEAELAGLAATSASLRGQQMTVRQLARWAVADSDDSILGSDVADVSRIVREYLLPLATVRHPEVLAALAGTSSAAASARASRDRLLARPWSQPTVDSVAEVDRFVDGLSSLIQEADLDGAVRDSTSTVILQIPNPFASADTALDLPDFPRIDDKRRDLVWNAIVAPPATAPTTVSFDVLPRDLYVSDAYGAALSCNEVRPIITASALYAGIPDDAEARAVDGLNKISARFDKAQTFVLADGPKVLTLTPALGEPFGFEGRSPSLKLLAGAPGLAHVRIQDGATQLPGDYAGAAGLSPFETVTLPVARLHAVLAPNAARLGKVQALSIVMRVATRSTPTRLTWIETCRGEGL